MTVGLEPTVTIRNRLLPALALAISLCSLELLPPSSATGGGGIRSHIDVNDVLSLCSMAIATETQYLAVFRGFDRFSIRVKK